MSYTEPYIRQQFSVTGQFCRTCAFFNSSQSVCEAHKDARFTKSYEPACEKYKSRKEVQNEHA